MIEARKHIWNISKTSLILFFSAILTLSGVSQNCPPGPYSIGTSDIIPPCTICDNYDWGNIERHSYVSSTEGLNYGNVTGPDQLPYHDQWLDLYVPSSSASGPYPVYIFAHAGGQFADDAFSNGRDFCEENIAFISWESVQSALAAGGSYYENNPNLLLTISDYWESAHADFERVLTWVWENAEEYELDLNNVFVGGGSRGSRISFKDLANPEHPIRGVFMTQAFADSDWFSLDMIEAAGCTALSIDEFVSEDYPPMLLHYKNNLGDVINAHDALNGIEIMERYDCFGINARVVHSLGNSYQWPPDAIEFITNIDSYFDIYPQKIVNGLIIDPQSNILENPTDLDLIWNETTPTGALLVWSSNGWEDNVLLPPYTNKEPDTIKVQLRLGPVNGLNSTVLGDICDPLYWDTDYYFNPTGENNSFFFPKNGELDACLLPYPDGIGYFSLDEGQFYGVQIRCNATPESNYFEQRTHKFWTAWTDLLTFEGTCEDVIDNIGSIDLNNVITVYPNPANEIVQLSSRMNPFNRARLEIIDISGEVRYTKRFTGVISSEAIDLGHLSKGMYWLRITTEASTITKSIVLR